MNETPGAPQTPSLEPENKPVVSKRPLLSPRRRILVLSGGLLLLLVLCVGLGWFLGHKATPSIVSTKTSTPTTKTTPKTAVATGPGLNLDTTKDYGDKYASGVLPVGDGKYQSTGAKQGYVYTCDGYARNLGSGANGGAGKRGPWFSADGTTYDINKKSKVQGSVVWQASFTNTLAGSTRTIKTNDLPVHTTGIFPILASDPAYAYDRNPNSIKAQDYTYALAANPSYGDPQCIGGQVGIMLTGVALFSGFDADGRDAGAWEVQDSCSGHPEKEGEYHYHTLSSCIKDISVKTVIGYALDGFPITGPQLAPHSILTTSDLDECHGITSQILLDGKQITSYHYVMTQDFPYSVSCYRATAIQPPGLAAKP